MFRPNDRVVIAVPSGGQEPTFVIGTVLRIERSGHIVTSDGRTYAATGGEDLGNHSPRHVLHAATPKLEWLVLVAACEQRVLGLVARYGRGGQCISTWNIATCLGLVEGAHGRENILIEHALKTLVKQRLITPVPGLHQRYRLTPTPA